MSRSILGGLVMLMLFAGCGRNGFTDSVGDNHNAAADQRGSDLARDYPLDTLPVATITAKEQSIRVWLAREDDPTRPGVVQEGLMHVPSGEIEDNQGMLFVFPEERVRGFWMLDTITPLDIAFARANGTIVRIWQMPPLTLQTFSSVEPAMFALEMKQGAFARLNIREGDRLEISPDVFTAP
jgi:uncharacterized membrane protein (UPF0127 family)